jgi:thioredoxin-like negative regulator of GroEL
LFSPEIQSLIWLAAGGIWIASAVISAGWVAGLRMSGPSADDEDLFNAAQSEYLKGNWYEAEVALGQLLNHNVVDVEARLMLAALLRRTGRSHEASEQLTRLSRTEGAERWLPEIAQLRKRLAEQAAETTRVSVVQSDAAAEKANHDSIDDEQVSQAA